MPHRPAVEDGEDVAERQDREEIVQARTRLGHMQLEHAQVDDVAVKEDRHRQEAQEPNAQLGRDQLQRGRRLVVDRVGQRQHVDQMQDRRPEMLAHGPAETEQEDAAHPQDRRIGDDVGNVGQFAQGSHQQGESHHRHAGPAVVHRTGPFGVFLELAQEQQRRQDRDERPVAVFRKLPGRQKRAQPVGQEQPGSERGQEQPERPPVRERGKALEDGAAGQGCGHENTTAMGNGKSRV